MKGRLKMKFLKRCLAIYSLCAVLLVTSALASVKASEQIYRYYMNVTPGSNGTIYVDFSISATGIMKNIGAESIIIYKNGTYGWEYVDRLDAEDVDMDGTAMSASDLPHYGGTIKYPGEINQEYRVIVTVFAEDYEGGSDSRSKTFTVET